MILPIPRATVLEPFRPYRLPPGMLKTREKIIQAAGGFYEAISFQAGGKAISFYENQKPLDKCQR
jgi:hypothetical protein